MKHKFVVNDENNVNEYGYRVMTDGIDTAQFMRNPVVLYMHNRAHDDVSKVIGRAVALEKKDGQLIAEVELDEADEFAKKIAGKVERGFIKMASFYADVKETSTDSADVLPGQIFETVTKSKMVEMSIVDIGGNDNALKLSRNGQSVQLNKLETKIDMDTKTIALSLGMDANTNADSILSGVRELKLAKEKAETRVQELEANITKTQKAEAETLVDKAVKLGLIPEGLKESQVKAFENDFDGQKVTLAKLIEEKEADAKTDEKHGTVREVVLGGKGSKSKGGVELSFDYLQKNDVEELRRVRDEEPQKYAQLAKDYANGKRYNEK